MVRLYVRKRRNGDKYENKAELLGGIILVLLGVKILAEHLNLF